MVGVGLCIAGGDSTLSPPLLAVTPASWSKESNRNGAEEVGDGDPVILCARTHREHE